MLTFPRKRPDVAGPIALVRPVGDSIVDCELTHLAREPIDVERARAQHADYVAALEWLGCRVVRLPALDRHPDAPFVEDPVVALDEVAIALPMGTDSRRGEVDSVVEAVRPHRPVRRIEPPATIEGGDVLRVGRTLYVGRTSRTSDQGIAALSAIVGEWGYRIRPVDVTGCLHLKTACTVVGRHLVLNTQWVDADAFEALEPMPVPDSEPFGANTLTVGDRTLVSASAPETAARLEIAGYAPRPVDISEFEKAEAGVTCHSVVVPHAR